MKKNNWINIILCPVIVELCYAHSLGLTPVIFGQAIQLMSSYWVGRAGWNMQSYKNRKARNICALRIYGKYIRYTNEIFLRILEKKLNALYAYTV